MDAKQCFICGEYFYAYEDEDVCPVCVKEGQKDGRNVVVDRLRKMFGV